MPIQSHRPAIAEANYPPSYRAREVSAILRAIRARQSVLICGLGGSGKSHLLRFLVFHPTLVEQLDVPSVMRLYLDCNAAIADDAAGVFRALLIETGADTPLPTEAADALATLRRVLAASLTPGARYVIVLDRFERIPIDVQPDVLDGLRHLRDYLDRRVSYVLGCRTPPPIATLSEEFDDLLAEPAVVWIGPLALEDMRWNVRAILDEQAVQADASVIDALGELSGGHGRLLRAVTLAWADDPREARLCAAELLRSRQVERICENIWRELDDLSQQLAQRLVQGEQAETPTSHPLRLIGLLRQMADGRTIVANPLLERYIKTREAPLLLELTALEQRLWEIVQARPGVLLKRNDLIAEIYGDDPDGINDEALTALVARLRRKVEKAGFGTIEALRGQGYRFAPNLLRVS
jgi:hypothetical protein